MAKIYLIPTPLSQSDLSSDINRHIINELDYFVVENLRTARRFLASLKLDRKIDEIEFVELSEHTDPQSVHAMLGPIIAEGRSCGVMSEAGLPCVADPGSLLVAAAHVADVQVVPLVGASSIMLALMASGASGQNFAFNGYLPIKPAERSVALKKYEKLALQSGQTQIFIETPYRNMSLFADIVKICSGNLKLCLASDLTGKDPFIRSSTIVEWRHLSPLIDKRPTIFIVYQ